MTDEEIDRLEPGLYRVYYDESHDISVAAVGRDRDGRVWFAPTNWVNGSYTDWHLVRRVELIATQESERKRASHSPLGEIPAEVVKDLRETLAAVREYVAKEKELLGKEPQPVTFTAEWETRQPDIRRALEEAHERIVRDTSPQLIAAQCKVAVGPFLAVAAALERFLTAIALPPKTWGLIRALLDAPADFDFAAALADHLEEVTNVDGTPLRVLRPQDGDVLVFRGAPDATTVMMSAVADIARITVEDLRLHGRKVVGVVLPHDADVEHLNRDGMGDGGWVRAGDAYLAVGDEWLWDVARRTIEGGYRGFVCGGLAVPREEADTAESLVQRFHQVRPPHPGEEWRLCGPCGGTGGIVPSAGSGIPVACNACHGTGRIRE